MVENSSDSPGLPGVSLGTLCGRIKLLKQADPKNELLPVLEGSADMKVYKSKLQDDLKAMEADMVSRFVASGDSLLRLYKETRECEELLSGMESTLNQFADSLRGVSDEIRQLQAKSEDLSAQLKTRSETQEKLIGFVDGAVISPDLVTVICDEEDCCSSRFISAITELGRKVKAHALLDQDLPAVVDSGPELLKLKQRAIARIRDYIAGKLSLLKQQKIDLKLLQSDHLLKCKPLMDFLKDVDNGMYHMEVANLYTSTMSKFYLNIFKTYLQNLSKLPLEQAPTKQDLIGLIETTPSAELDLMSRLKLTSSFTSKGGNFFSISGGRDRVIKDDSPPMSVGGDVSPTKHFPESLLRSYVKLFADNLGSESEFLTIFFGNCNFFDPIFAKSVSLISDHITTSLIKDSFDCVSLILSVGVMERFEEVLVNRKKISQIESFFENILSQLRMRLRYVIDQHVDSLKRIDTKKLQPLSLSNPAVITRRFGELSASLLSVRQILSADDQQLTNNIEALLNTYDAFLSTLSKKFASPLEQQIYQLNNLDLIVSLHRGISARYEEKMHRFTSVFVEQKLGEHFGPLIKLTMDGERSASSVSLGDLERQTMNFHQNWKSGTGKVNQEICAVFSNPATANEIVKTALTQLLLYYTRFHKVVAARTAAAAPQPPWVRQLVPTGVLMAEIKQLQNS